ncbi:ribonuclease domain-containing protein [Geobacter grbiciae]|uniref:ribonuclease domain-containing protein n=1 Tax=Geobacter grbiciae TaxID=155042 RepID=UPI001C02EE1E|nr:ribonuclease domain-containing protein [Geobacter grbiciae]MBT1075665.1 ribonuclease [Geobacter grbiciae]
MNTPVEAKELTSPWHHRKVPVLATLMILALPAAGFGDRPAYADSCADVVHQVNRQLRPTIDEGELAAMLQSLNGSNNRNLPPKFVTKSQAKKMGWRPGRDLWASTRLKGKSIGGDRFANREGRLPAGGKKWHEADLDYKGGHRGAKRLIYSNDGLRMVTVDHYRTFTEVPPCQ